MNNFDGVDFSERRSEEVIHFFWHSVYITSVASFLVLGGQDPQMYRQKKRVTYMRERAKRASASET